MRIAHISDIHWRGISRHEEYRDAFTRLFNLLRELKPDIIVNTGDTFHTKTHGITPEAVEALSWMFHGLASIAPVHSILGNHDGNLSNPVRQDVITPIHLAIAQDTVVLYKRSGVYPLNAKFSLGVFSAFDREGWSNVKPVPGRTNIALYHGSVDGCRFDNEHMILASKADTSMTLFSGFDFVMLGDIHTSQYTRHRTITRGGMSESEIVDFAERYGASQVRLVEGGVELQKPDAGFAGSLIQQNFGEDPHKGFLLWEIDDQDTWDVRFIELPNHRPFVTVPWQGGVDETLAHVESLSGENGPLPGTRYRISATQYVPGFQVDRCKRDLKEHYKAETAIFHWPHVVKNDWVNTASVKIQKKSLCSEPDVVIRLFLDWVESKKDSVTLTPDQVEIAESVIRKYMTRLMTREADLITKTSTGSWSLKSLKFDNLFGYGKSNSIDFTKLGGVVGILGSNRSGKSSILGALMYSLFNTGDRGPMKTAHIIHNAATRCRSEAVITVDGVDYLVERQSHRVIPKRASSKADPYKTATSVNFFRLDEGPDGTVIKRSKNSIDRDRTDQEIRKLIGSSSDFLLAGCSAQGDEDRFLSEGPTERRHILSRFMELDLFKRLEDMVKRDQTLLELKSDRRGLLDSDKMLATTKKAVSRLEVSLSSLEESVESAKVQHDNTKLWLMRHEQAATEVDFSQVELLEQRLVEFEPEHQSRQDKVLQAKTQLRELKKELTRNRQQRKKHSREELDQQLTELGVIRLSVNELRNELNKQEMNLRTKRTNVRKLELVPCGDEYPTCFYIRDAHVDRGRLAKQTETVQTLTGQLDAQERVLNKFLRKQFDRRIAELDSLEKQKVELESSSSSLTHQVDLWKSEQKSLRATARRDQKLLEELRKKVDLVESREYEKKQELLRKQQDRLETLEQEVQKTLIDLGGKRTLLDTLASQRASIEGAVSMLHAYDAVIQAFSKTGIPAMVLKGQLPAINAELTRILSEFVDFKIELDMDIASNAMDIFLVTENGSRTVIETASGAEKLFASLALRVALLNLTSLPRPDFLIIDEGFGALDEHSMQSCIEMLTFLKSYFKTVFVISHVNAVKELVDQCITIRRHGEISRVQV